MTSPTTRTSTPHAAPRATGPTSAPAPSTLVLGGTGKTGRRVAARLASLGGRVRVGSRHGVPAFDWDDRATWPGVLRGADAAYVAYAPDLAFPGAAERVGDLARLAVTQGVRRVVLLSGRREAGARAGEEAVAASGAEWTVVRSAWFMQNFSEHVLVGAVLDGVVALPAGDVEEPFVDAEDVAEVAVAALTEGGHAGEVYEVTGPRLLTMADAVAEIGRAAGREVRYLPVTAAEYAAAAVAGGVPVSEAVALADLFATVLDGRNAFLADGVVRALGREPRDFSEYVRRTSATGVWSGASR